jgi:hypothetical protein
LPNRGGAGGFLFLLLILNVNYYVQARLS